MCDSFNTDGYKQGCEQKLWGGYTQLILKKWIRYSATAGAGWSMGKRRVLRRWAGCIAAGIHGVKGCWRRGHGRRKNKTSEGTEPTSRLVNLNVFAGLFLAVQGTLTKKIQEQFEAICDQLTVPHGGRRGSLLDEDHLVDLLSCPPRLCSTLS